MRITVLSSLFLLAIAGVLLGATFAQRTGASGGGPEMALRVEGDGVACEPGVDIDTCTVPLSGEFTLTVDLLQAPEEGYGAAQAFVSLGSQITHEYRSAVEELVSPDCTKTFSFGKPAPPPPWVARGCSTGLLPPLPNSHYVGPLFEFVIRCSDEASATNLALLPFGEPPAGPNGAQLVLPDGMTSITPKVDSIRVVCGEEPAPKPEMALRVEGQGVVCEPGADIDTCTVPLSGEFTLTVDLLQAPEEGYGGFQTFVHVGEDLAYLPRPAIADEFLFPDCAAGVQLRTLSAQTVSHGCLTALVPPFVASHHTGPMVQIDLACSEVETTTTVRLLPGEADGTKLALPDAMTIIEPKLDSVEVACGTGVNPQTPPAESPMPTHTPTPTQPPPTATPMPGVLGDADQDGDITSLDAALILQYVAGLLGPAGPPGADVNADGLVDSEDAQLILQYVAGLLDQLAP